MCIVQKSCPSFSVKVKGQGRWRQKTKKCGILFGSHRLGCVPRVALFGERFSGGLACMPLLRRWENQRTLSSFSALLLCVAGQSSQHAGAGRRQPAGGVGRGESRSRSSAEWHQRHHRPHPRRIGTVRARQLAVHQVQFSSVQFSEF